MISKKITSNRTVVVSAVALVDGGPLTVLRDAIRSFDTGVEANDRIVFLVAGPEVHEGIEVKNVEFEYFPKAKRSWLIRLYLEYLYFYFYSILIGVDTWFSLHDVTPNVRAKKRFVYCHNPSIFLKMPFKDILVDHKMYIFTFLYKYVYAINIKKNKAVIVQQAWIAKEFEKRYRIKNLIVARPDVSVTKVQVNVGEQKSKRYRLFYPAFPRYFKNHEILYKVAENISDEFEIAVTISRSESKLIKKLEMKYPNANRRLRYLGRISRSEVERQYELCDALVFPSLLETWGLPIIEVMQYGKPIILAELAYAKETAGGYNAVYFFDPLSHHSLTTAIESARKGLAYDEYQFLANELELQGWRATVGYVLSE